MPLSICSPLSLYVPLYVYFSVSFYLSQSLSFSCSFVSLPLILYRERAAVCLCVCVFVSVCVCMCVPFSLSLSLSLSLTVSYLPVHTQTTNGITIFSSLLTPINCYTSPTLAQWKTMFPCREMSFLIRKQSPSANTGQGLHYPQHPGFSTRTQRFNEGAFSSLRSLVQNMSRDILKSIGT